MVARKWGEYSPAQALTAGSTVSCLMRSSERCGEVLSLRGVLPWWRYRTPKRCRPGCRFRVRSCESR